METILILCMALAIFFGLVAVVLCLKNDKDAKISAKLAFVFAVATLFCYAGKSIQDKRAEEVPTATETRR